jgi:hypothetical protein
MNEFLVGIAMIIFFVIVLFYGLYKAAGFWPAVFCITVAIAAAVWAIIGLHLIIKGLAS